MSSQEPGDSSAASGDASQDAFVPVDSSWEVWEKHTQSIVFLCAWFLPGMLLGAIHSKLPALFPGLVIPLGMLLIGGLATLVLQANGDVSVGRDGLRHSWLTRTREYHWGDVREVRQRVGKGGGPPMLELMLIAGGVARIPLLRQGELASQLLAFAQEKLEAFRSRVPGESLPALDRGGRDARAWVRHLRAIAGGSASHAREGYVSTDVLLRVVEDATQPALARASAVVAAASQLSPDEVERVRVIASSAVDDSLRSAMEGALDPEREEQALAEALDALEQAQSHK